MQEFFEAEQLEHEECDTLTAFSLKQEIMPETFISL